MPDRKKDCFVVGPIGPVNSEKRIHTEWVRDAIIKPVLEPDFMVHHPLEMAQPGLIDTQVISFLLNAELVIADLTTQNPNAFYEIGIRHMAQKPIIHMHKVGEEIPFDLSLYRSIEFSLVRPQDVEEAKAHLRKAVAAVMDVGYKVDNPVTHARGIVQLHQHASDPQRILLDEMEAIKDRLGKIEKSSVARHLGDGLRGLSNNDILLHVDFENEDQGPFVRKLSLSPQLEQYVQTLRAVEEVKKRIEAQNKGLEIQPRKKK